MKLSDHLPNIKTGDLLVWSDKKSTGMTELVEKIIRFFTMSEYCHVGVAYVECNKPLVFEAVIPSVHLFPLTTEKPFYHIPMGVEWNSNLHNFIMENIGKPYSVLDAIRGYFGTPNPDNQWQCVELAHTFYKLAGMDFGDAFTPSTFVDAVLSNRQTSLTFINQP